jgi:hypothetical protein
MQDEDIREFGELWAPEAKQNYCLISVYGDGIELERCVIYSRATKTAKIISDDKLALEVKKKMFETGVPILRRPPVT